ncbi:MAG: dihydroorotase [Methanoregula sp.]|nr:dihydroorotase [Methanoregula sp.]
MAPPPTLVLQNVMLPSGRVADLSLASGKVNHVGAYKGSAEKCDCRGCFVLPAAIDMHVHMRGGVQSAKEDWASGSKSAIAGGVTVVVDQPNTIPPVTAPHVLVDRVQDARNHSYCNFAINSGVTPDTPLEAMWEAGAMAFGEIFHAPSSYGDSIDGVALEAAFDRIQKLGGLATIHAERIGTSPDTDLVSHALVRSALGEADAVRTVQFLNRSECRLHFCHMSSVRSIDAATGSVEVTPHHLFLSQEQFDKSDTSGKVNPPLRTEAERDGLWVRWNRIDVIASDHAPHTRDEKKQDFSGAPSGIPGVETMVPLLLAQVIAKKIDLASVIDKTSYAPARLLGISRAGFNIGDRADFAIYSKKPVPIRAESLHSRCGWTPFEGQKAIFPNMVVMNGSIAYLGGEFTRQEPTWFAGKGFDDNL